MNFVGFANPLGLLGMFTLPVILALHMLRERSRSYVVSSLTLWSFLEKEVRGSRPRRIPITWLLLVDLSIASLLSLAWAQPLISRPTTSRQAQHKVILLDVSTSMLAKDIVPSRFAQARLEVISLVTNLGPRDAATVVTFGTTPRWVGDTRQIPVQELLTRISAIQPGETGNSLEAALALALASVEEDIPLSIRILTDAAYPQPDLRVGNYPVQWRIFGKRVSNQSITHISTSRLGTNRHQVFARIGNFGNQSVRQVVSLIADGVPVDSTTMVLPSNSVVSQVWTVTGGPVEATVLLTGDDALPPDNKASIGFTHARLIGVNLVAADPEPLEKALRSIPDIDLRVLAPDEYISGMQADVFFFKGFIPRAWPTGISVAVEPPTDTELLPIRGLEQIGDLPVPSADSIMAAVDFSGVRWSKAWVLDDIPEGFAPLLQANDLPLVAYLDQDNSQVYLLLMDLSAGNLTRHPAFPIFLAHLIRTAIDVPLPAQIHTGEMIPVPVAKEYPRITIKPPNGEILEFTSQRPSEWVDTLESGAYAFELIDLDGRRSNVAVGVNSGAEVEADIRPREWVVEASQQDQATGHFDADQTIILLPWLLGLAVFLLILEAWLAWR